MQKSESYWKEGTVSQKKNRGATGEDHGTTAIQKKDNIRRRKRTRNIRIKVEDQAKNQEGHKYKEEDKNRKENGGDEEVHDYSQAHYDVPRIRHHICH